MKKVKVVYKGIIRPGIIVEERSNKSKIKVYYNDTFNVADLIYFNWFDNSEILPFN